MPLISGPRLFVLSDIHGTDSSFLPPLRPDAPQSAVSQGTWIDFANATAAPRNPLATLPNLIAEHDITADFLLVPGDLCDKANGKALDAVWRKLHDIASLLGSAEIVATVGNHDIDSRYRGHAYDTKAVLRRLDPKFPLADANQNNAYWANAFAVIERTGIRFVIVNSCAYHGGAPEELKHGRVSDDTLREIKRVLASSAACRFNVVLCHHPAMPFAIGTEGDDDRMLNGENLIAQLDSDANTWLFVHGHRHVGRVQYGLGEHSAPILFSAGAVGAHVEMGKTLSVRNQCHLVSLYANDNGEVPLGGVVRSWDYTIDVGWFDATPLDGLPASCGFGYRGQPSVLAAKVADAVRRQGAPVDWPDLQSTLPEVQFLTPNSFKALAEELRNVHGLEVVPSWDNPVELAEAAR